MTFELRPREREGPSSVKKIVGDQGGGRGEPQRVQVGEHSKCPENCKVVPVLEQLQQVS